MNWRLALAVLACLAAAGCADNGKNSDESGSRFGGFYGGVNGGVAP